MHRSLDVMMRLWRGAIGRGSGPDSGNGHGHAKGNGNAAATTEAPTPREETRPVEPPWLAQLDRDGIPRSLHYPTTTLARLVDQAAERFGDQPALIYNQKRWIYRD